MKIIYGANCQQCYTDSDSLIYPIQTEDVYQYLKQHLEWFDTSDYAENNIYNVPRVHKNVPGHMKNGNKVDIMLPFFGFGAKMYSISVKGKNGGECEIQKAKGFNGYVVKNRIDRTDTYFLQHRRKELQ